MILNYKKHVRVSLKDDPRFSEKWIQDRIKEDPSILGLGDLELKDAERMHPKAGRLDLLLRDPESGKRYELELMLGAVDESHIIRTIEYWDIERSRYPQDDHCAVIVAETITARFQNVIGLFNKAIPMIALELQAIQIGDDIALVFTKVLDELVRGEDDEDDSPESATDRTYWEGRGSKTSLAMLDECFGILREIDPTVAPKYNKHYVGISENGQANNYILFHPKKTHLNIAAKVADLASWAERIDEAGFVRLPGAGEKRLRFSTTAQEINENRQLLNELFRQSRSENQD